jgi:AcrR family transcriptional regulator
MTSRAPAPARRRYDNTLRRERAAQTRERIVTSGAELLRESPVRDWRSLTVRSIAQRAGINERTVFRHFASERALRDAVMHRQEQDAGIDLAQLSIDGIGDAAARILRYVAAYPTGPAPDLEPTLADASRRQHQALIRAVEAHAEGWAPADRTLAAAMLDVLWAVSSYERLVIDWHLDSEEAIRGITWVIGLLQQAILDGSPAPKRKPARRAAAGAS